MGTSTFSGPVVSTAGFVSGSGSLVTADAATLAVTSAEHSGRTILMDIAGAQAVTLPAATGTGNVYRVFVKTTITTARTITTDGSDIMAGAAIIANDGGATASIFVAATATVLTMNGTTQGGILGATVELQDVAAATWAVQYVSSATGTEATPFS